MATVNQVFQSAPMGRRLVYATVFAFAVLLVVVGVNLYLSEIRYDAHADPRARLLQALAPFLAPLIMVPIFLFERSRVARFSIEDNVLVLGRKRYALEGLVEIGADPKVLRRAFKKCANGGLGAIRGSYWSRRMGSFYAFLTDTDKAVVLRWPDKTVAVSPSDTEFFIFSAKAAAGLR